MRNETIVDTDTLETAVEALATLQFDLSQASRAVDITPEEAAFLKAHSDSWGKARDAVNKVLEARSETEK